MLFSGDAVAVHAVQAADVTLRNCEILKRAGGYPGAGWTMPAKGKMTIANSVLSEYLTLQAAPTQATLREVEIMLEHNTIRGTNTALEVRLWNPNLLVDHDEVIRIRAIGNVFDGAQGDLAINQWADGTLDALAKRTGLPYSRLVGWSGRDNLHQAKVWYADRFKQLPGFPATKSLDEWNSFWKIGNTDSQIGRPKYATGDIAGRLQTDWEKMTAQDFRLAEDSPGFRASKDGKDLGADIDLVGPGAAYERWRKTPAYQQWLKDSGQVK
jgi:hypothetical protein